MAQERYGEAEPLFRRALDTRERVLGSEHPDTLQSFHKMGLLRQAQGDRGEAEMLLRHSLEWRERVLGPEHPDTIAVRGDLSILLVQMHRPAEALRIFKANDQALAYWTDSEVHAGRWEWRRHLILHFTRRYQDVGLSLALTHPFPDAAEFTADLVMHWNKRVASSDAMLHNLVGESRDPALLAAIERVQAARRALSAAVLSQNIAGSERMRLREALDTAEAELRAASDRFRRFLTVREANADDVRDALAAGSVLVEYKFFRLYDFDAGAFTGETHLLAAILHPEKEVIVVDLGDAQPILRVQRSILAGPTNGELQALLREGYQALISPLLPHFEDVETLFVIPDGSLHALPFGALVDESGQYLVQHFAALHLLQTGSALVVRDRPETRRGLVAVGGVDFGPSPPPNGAGIPLRDEAAAMVHPAASEDSIQADQGSTSDQIWGFGPLPGTEEEVERVAEVYAMFRPDDPEPVVLTGANATERAIKTLAVPPYVLHLATHGYHLKAGVIEGRPLLQSGIALAGANRALTGEVSLGGENGVLHAVEAKSLNLYGTELVVLSICDSAQGVDAGSEGIEGLSSAFYSAGAKNVLAALWPIDDRLPVAFMTRFYYEWLSRPGITPAEALQNTKLRYITSPNPAERDPATWAPFVLYEG